MFLFVKRKGNLIYRNITFYAFTASVATVIYNCSFYLRLLAIKALKLRYMKLFSKCCCLWYIYNIKCLMF